MSNETYAAARSQLSSGLVSEVVQRFGPILGEILLKWLLSRQQAGLIPAHALVDGSTMRSFLASQLRVHRSEILAAINTQTAALFDAGVAALDS